MDIHLSVLAALHAWSMPGEAHFRGKVDKDSGAGSDKHCALETGSTICKVKTNIQLYNCAVSVLHRCHCQVDASQSLAVHFPKQTCKVYGLQTTHALAVL